MSSIGITGHQRLPREDDWQWVAAELEAAIAPLKSPLVGITSLAIGADQLFARLIIAAGGDLTAVLPFEGYSEKLDPGDRKEFERLVRLSKRREILTRAGSDQECYLAAGRRVVDLSDSVIAVWDGRPARGLGGTADIVDYAVARRVGVIHINPNQHVVTRM